MSPPIYTPDGSEVSEIVLPDGSTASEVIDPDGNVVFEAGPDIPDSAIAQYDFRLEDGTTPVTDQTESGNDLGTGSYTGVGASINGNQAGEFAESEFVEGAFQSTSERIVVYTVFNLYNTTSGGTFRVVTNDTSGSGSVVIVASFEDQWFINQGSSIGATGTPSTGTNYIATTIFDATDEFRLNGSSLFTGDAGTNSLTNLSLGGGDNVDGADTNIGFVEIHSGTVSGGLQTREQEIADSWGISI